MSNLLKEYKIKLYAITNMALLCIMLVSGEASLLSAGVFTVVFLLFLWMEPFKPNKIDIVILLLFLYELILGNSYSAQNNSFRNILIQYIFTIHYFMVRVSLNDRKSVRLSLRLISIFFILISLFCLASFYVFQENVLSAGFDNLYDFKYLYRPFGNLNNIWATFLLSFLLLYFLFAIFYGTRKKLILWLVLCIPLVSCIFFSFSRGIYICLGIILITLLLFLIISKKIGSKYKILIILGVILSLVPVCLLYEGEVLRTIRLTETVSQQRSLESRLSSLSYLKPVMQEIPFLGIGTGNYSLAMDKYLYQNDDNSFTDIAPNIISQLLIEKGLIGLSFWMMLGLFLVLSLWKIDKVLRYEQLYIIFAIIVLLLREMSFSSLLLTLGLQLMLALFLGIFVNNSNYSKKHTFGKRSNIIITMTLLCIFTYCILLNIRHNSHRMNIEKFKVSLENRLYNEAEQYLNKCHKNNTATLYYYSALYGGKYIHMGNHEDKERSRSFLSEAIVRTPWDIRLQYDYAMVLWRFGEREQAKVIFEDLCENYPYNSLIHATIGNVLYMEGNKRSAASHFAKAIELMPSILETDNWEQFKTNDSLSYMMVQDIILGDIENVDNSPIKNAKFGKVLYFYGDFEKAEKFLTNALIALPNLEFPWVGLWKIKLEEGDKDADNFLRKAKLLGFDEVNDQKKKRTTVIMDGAPFPINAESYSFYGLKFRLWYATEWYHELMPIRF